MGNLGQVVVGVLKRPQPLPCPLGPCVSSPAPLRRPSPSRIWGHQGPRPWCCEEEGCLQRQSQALENSKELKTADAWDFFLFLSFCSISPLCESLCVAVSLLALSCSVSLSLYRFLLLSLFLSLSLSPVSLWGPSFQLWEVTEQPLGLLACLGDLGHLGPGAGERWLELFTASRWPASPSVRILL